MTQRAGKISYFALLGFAFAFTLLGCTIQILSTRQMSLTLFELKEAQQQAFLVRDSIDDLIDLPLLSQTLKRSSFENKYYETSDQAVRTLQELSRGSDVPALTRKTAEGLIAKLKHQNEIDGRIFDLGRRGKFAEAQALFYSLEFETARTDLHDTAELLEHAQLQHIAQIQERSTRNGRLTLALLLASLAFSTYLVFAGLRQQSSMNDRLETLVSFRTGQLNYAQQIAKIGSWHFDMRTGHQHWSDEHYRIFEIENPQPPERLFQLYRERIHPEDRPELDRILERALKQGEDFTFDHRIILSHGTRIKHVRGIGKVAKDSNGVPQSISGTCQDMTDSMNLQRALEQERTRSMHNAKLASLGEMSAGIAHEVNNPLGIITGNIPLLVRFKDDPKKFSAKLETISKATVRIERIVRGLKKFSRSSEKNAHRLESLKELVSEAMVFVEAKAHRHATPITISVDETLRILCDGVEIEQVIINLVNNGIDAIKDSSDRWVRIDGFAEQDRIVLRVTDSGHGISTELEEKLFQPFFTTKPVGEGTGLGLSISRGILHQHKAAISINRSGPHTCFEVHFPKIKEEKNAA